jgi:hypothetical protein
MAERITNIGFQRERVIIENVKMGVYMRMEYCPFCGVEGEIERDCCDSDDDLFPEFRVPVECNNCGKKWFEIYSLKELWTRSR